MSDGDNLISKGQGELQVNSQLGNVSQMKSGTVTFAGCVRTKKKKKRLASNVKNLADLFGQKMLDKFFVLTKKA